MIFKAIIGGASRSGMDRGPQVGLIHVACYVGYWVGSGIHVLNLPNAKSSAKIKPQRPAQTQCPKLQTIGFVCKQTDETTSIDLLPSPAGLGNAWQTCAAVVPMSWPCRLVALKRAQDF